MADKEVSRGQSVGRKTSTGGGDPEEPDDAVEDIEADNVPVTESVLVRPGWRMRSSATLRLVRANPTGRIVLKVAVAVLGALVVAVGIFLIPFPGPGWAIVILGLAIWAIEFAWAKHLLQYTRRQVSRWTHWMVQRPLPVRVLLGLLCLVFILLVIWASVKVSFNVDLVSVIFD